MADHPKILAHMFVFLFIFDAVYCQTLEKFLLGKGLYKAARWKAKGKDKKVLLYGLGAVVKTVEGKVKGIIGTPLKLIGVILGPLGIPFKIIGGGLKAKSVADKAKAIMLTVKKYSRDSIRYG